VLMLCHVPALTALDFPRTWRILVHGRGAPKDARGRFILELSLELRCLVRLAVAILQAILAIGANPADTIMLSLCSVL